MTTLDLTPLYRSSVGFDHLESLLDNAYRTGHVATSYPPYNIERSDEDRYAVTLALAGFSQDEIDISVEAGVLTIKGEKREEEKDSHRYLYQGIASRTFERKFNLADHVEITGAKLDNGLLTIELKQQMPEAMKPKHIEISSSPMTTKKQIEPKKAA
ncbi:MAG: Hsp20 family protein [Thiohalomonadales bacterium]